MTLIRTLFLSTTLSLQMPSLGYGGQWCDELLYCYNSAVNAHALAETLRDNGHLVQWDTVRSMEALYFRLAFLVGTKCSFSDRQAEDAGERAYDRLARGLVNSSGQELQYLSAVIDEAKACEKNFK